jgi:hypothetical protein
VIGGVLLACAVVALAADAHATTVLPLDLPALVGQADAIFVGRVVEVRSGTDANGLAATWTTFDVAEPVKGAAAGFRVPALPRYRVGEEILLFLHAESDAGFTSPVGLGQGCFRIVRKDGSTAAVNDVGNRNLTAAPQASAARALADAPAPPASAPIALDDLLGRVRTLAAPDAR